MSKSLKELFVWFDAEPQQEFDWGDQPRWIPVHERLPEKPKYSWDGYIVQVRHILEPFSAFWDGEKWTDDYDYEIKNVIAWMPLPKPYKEVQKDD